MEGGFSLSKIDVRSRLAVVSFQQSKVACLVLENIQQMSSWPLFHANARNDDDNPSLKGGEVLGSGGYDESDASSHPALHAPGGGGDIVLENRKHERPNRNMLFLYMY